MAVSEAARLAAYNGALRRLGSRRLASLTENRHPRRVLDDIWEGGEVVLKVLARADWNFALRSIFIEYDPGIDPGFGYRYAFLKPTDFARASSVSLNEYFDPALVSGEYADEGDYWYCDNPNMYVKYVSTDGSWGQDSGKWTPAFKDYLEARMAFEACETITNSRTTRSDMAAEMDQMLKEAKSVDAMNEGVKMLPQGSWSRSRAGWGRRGDRTNSIP